MTRLDRRTLLLALSAALPALATRPVLARGRAGGKHALDPPDRPMIYTRALIRQLSGGSQLLVERSFSVRFRRVAGGFRVEGRQIRVRVEAPEALSSLAELERGRVEDGIFPLVLDPSGRIVEGEAHAATPAIGEAMRDIDARLAAMDLTGADRASLEAFVLAVHQAGAHIVSSLPPDLFAPVRPAQLDSHAITLPTGGKGAVSTDFRASRDPVTGLMRNARREVVTAVAGDLRRTIETFSLVPEEA